MSDCWMTRSFLFTIRLLLNRDNDRCGPIRYVVQRREAHGEPLEGGNGVRSKTLITAIKNIDVKLNKNSEKKQFFIRIWCVQVR